MGPCHPHRHSTLFVAAGRVAELTLKSQRCNNSHPRLSRVRMGFSSNVANDTKLLI